MKRLILALGLVAIMSGVGVAGVWDNPPGNVYWGDFHVHTQFSIDAYIGFRPEGRYAREAGEYALYCSKLDFYAVTDHSEMLTDRDYWPEAITAAQSFNQIGASRPDQRGDPCIVAFTGWEWTQQGPYGHKNVIMKWDDPKKLPPSPIRSLPGAMLAPGALEKEGHVELLNGLSVPELLKGLRYGRKDLTFLAIRPKDLWAKLRKYCTDAGIGCDALVIPHGNAWGQAPTMYTDWSYQLDAENQDPRFQKLIEVYSKHGNSEQYRDTPPDYRYYRNGIEESEEACSEPDASRMTPMARMILSQTSNPDTVPRTFRKPFKGCEKVCQEPTESYIPCCWQAGEIVKERCVDPNGKFCKAEIALAQKTVIPFSKGVPKSKLSEIKAEFRADPAKAFGGDWGTCGQCRDCYQPAFNYIQRGTAQKALASAYFDADGKAHHYTFGFIGSTDTHRALAGSVKESKADVELHARMAAMTNQFNPDTAGWERAANFLNPGSLMAVISPRRDRDDIWAAVEARRVYSTSGPRMEVWARAEVDPNGSPAVVDMGAETSSGKNPTFHIRVNGAFAEDDTCRYDDQPEIKSHLTPQEFDRVCADQCYNVTDKRLKIARIEVIKILQPMTPEEAKAKSLVRSASNPKGLIMDPYFTQEFSNTAVEWSWSDPEFAKEPKGRSVAYYFRIIQEPTMGYNCNPAYILESGRNCDEQNPSPEDLLKRTNPQSGPAEKLSSIPDVCYTDPKDPKTFCEERAWTSPFYIVRD